MAWNNVLGGLKEVLSVVGEDDLALGGALGVLWLVDGGWDLHLVELSDLVNIKLGEGDGTLLDGLGGLKSL